MPNILSNSLRSLVDPAGLFTGSSGGGGGAAVADEVDPQLAPLLQQYFQSDPAFASEYARVRAAGDKRSALEWMYDHIQTSPQDLQKFSQVVQTGGTNGAVPLEQDLLGRVVDAGYDDLNRDAGRRTAADTLFGQLQPIYDNNLRLIGDLSNGNLLNQENDALGTSTTARLANLQEQLGTVGGAQSDQTAARLKDLNDYRVGVGGNIDTEIASLQAGMNPVLAARLQSAAAQEAAVNNAAQQARDQAVAQDALKGFVGGSTTLDQALLRASTAGLQGAAGLRTDAQLANATDQYGLEKYGANQRRSLADLFTGDTRTINDDAATTARLLSEYGAGETRGIKDAQATGKVGLLENDINRRIAGLGLPTTFSNDYFAGRTAADNYSSSGMNRLLNQLNWFAGGGTPPTATPTTGQAFDNGLTSLGTGIAGLGTELMKTPAWTNLFKTNPPTTPAATSTNLYPTLFGNN